MNRIRSLRLSVLLVLLVFQALPASAVGMWARRYGVECSACHAYPSLQLTNIGLDFMRRGHRMDKDTYDPVVAHMVSAHGEWNYQIEEKGSTSFESPDLHLHVGGALSPRFSAYVDANVNNDFEVAYMQYTQTQKGDSYFTARAGKLIPTLVRNYGSGLMGSASSPLILTDTTVGPNPFTPSRDSTGIDVAERWKSLYVQAGVLNGEDVEDQVAVNHHKDFYATAEWNSEIEPTGVGLYYFRGGYDLLSDAPDPIFDRYDRLGGFLNYTTDQVRLVGGYLTGKDQRTLLADRKIHGYFAQVEAHPADWAAPFTRYDDVQVETEEGTDHLKQLSIGCALRLFENDVTGGRLVIEVARKDEAGAKTNSALLNLI